jgi:hypothetical protein
MQLLLVCWGLGQRRLEMNKMELQKQSSGLEAVSVALSQMQNHLISVQGTLFTNFSYIRAFTTSTIICVMFLFQNKSSNTVYIPFGGEKGDGSATYLI